MLKYLLIGIIFTWVIDINARKMDIKFDNWERIICALLWPFALANFLVGYIKSRFFNKKK